MDSLSLELILDFAEDILKPIGICVVLPIIIVWLNMRRKTNETNRRTEVLLAAIEKNPDLDMDMEDLIRKMNPKTKTTKERLMSRLLWGLVFIAISTSLLLSDIYVYTTGGVIGPVDLFTSGCLLLIGISFVAVFFISKRMLAKEIEAEEKKALEK
jgi:hypothetical protein